MLIDIIFYWGRLLSFLSFKEGDPKLRPTEFTWDRVIEIEFLALDGLLMAAGFFSVDDILTSIDGRLEVILLDKTCG